MTQIHNRLFTNNLPLELMDTEQKRDIFIAGLQHALENEEFILHYQPVISVENGKIIGMEALLRWQHPAHGLLSPNLFLPLCEKTGLIVPLGAWIFRTACEQIKKWQEMGYYKLGIAINLSVNQLNHPELLNLITNTLETTKIPSSSLTLEITESMVMQNTEANIKLLNAIRNLGLQLALDDFGTGYSSLNYLKQFPFNIIKIDKSFVSDMTTNITSLAIAESIISLGKTLGLMLVAEGVENESQLNVLKKMKCDMVQGYFYSKPISAEKFTQFLQEANNICRHQVPRIFNEEVLTLQYEILQKEHHDQVVDVITHSFCEDEPMTKYLGLTYREFIPFARLIVAKAIQDGLSIVALDGDKISACTIVEDITNPININNEIDSRFKIIFSLLEQLGSDFFNDKTIQKGHLAHLFITAVNKNYFGKGLSKKVNFESSKLAMQKGFDFMCCEFTHPYNEKGTIKYLKNKKILLRTCNYKDFIFEGKKFFENLKGSASAYIWELREGAKLHYSV